MKITIASYLDKKKYIADFEFVRSGGPLVLGWATIKDDDCTLRFPAIVTRYPGNKGDTVYTVSDWQAPLSVFGDLSSAEDWAFMCSVGQGQFINSRLKHGNPISVKALDLPLPAKGS